MKKLNSNIIQTITRNLTTKTQPCTDHASLMMQFFYVLMNFFKYTEDNIKAYEVALWIKSKQNLINNKGKEHTKFYQPKTIVHVDLGNNTFGREFSYMHPCIVIYNEYRKLFVVPCTSQPARRNSSGNLYPEIMEGTTTDGFAKTTTVMVNEARFIDKTRVVDTLGKVSDTFFNELYNKLFGMIFESKEYSLKKLQDDNNKLKSELESISKENKFLLEQIQQDKQQNLG